MNMLNLWQFLSKNLSMNFIHKINFEFDYTKILSEFNVMEKEFILKTHEHYENHDGGFTAISLYSEDGKAANYLKTKNIETIKTEIGKFFPYTISIVEQLKKKFGASTRRVRFMKLTKGTNIHWHYDWDECISLGNCRLHIPLIVNDESSGCISHQYYQWKPGEIWYGDFSFPHKVFNNGTSDRLHFIIDLYKPKKFLNEDELFQKEEQNRNKYKKLIMFTYKLSYRLPKKMLAFR